MDPKIKTVTMTFKPSNESNAPLRPLFEPGHNPDSDPRIWRSDALDAGGSCTPTQSDWTLAFNEFWAGTNTFYTLAQYPQSIPAAEVAEMGRGQNPFAVVVCCSDSRVAPEILLGQTLGEIFVVRTAGNVVDKLALASIEYAVFVLKVQLVIFLGHDNCGAIRAAAEQWAKTAPPAPCSNMGTIVQSIIDTTLNPNASSLQDLNGDPTNQTYLSQAAMWNSQAQAMYAFNNSEIIKYGAQVLWGHIVMVQPPGSQTANGQVCGCADGTIYPFGGEYAGPSRPSLGS